MSSFSHGHEGVQTANRETNRTPVDHDGLYGSNTAVCDDEQDRKGRPGARSGDKGIESLVSGFHMVVSHHVGGGNQTPVGWKSALTTAPSLQLHKET